MMFCSRFLWFCALFWSGTVFCQEQPRLNSLGMPKDLTIDSTARITCVAFSGDQPIDFHWFRNGEPLDFGSVQQLDEWTSSLTISPLLLEYVGNYTCKASNEFGSAQVTAPLQITAPPQWVSEPLDVKVHKGTTAVFHCNAFGSPPVRTVWRRKLDNNQEYLLPSALGNFQVFSNGTLVVSNAQKSENGIYVCDVSNGVGNGLHKNVRLTVFEYPVVEAVLEHVTVERGSAAHMSCLAKGDHPLSFDWLKNQSSITDAKAISHRISFSELSSADNVQFTITIGNTDLKDEGLYTCVVKNEFGSDKKSVRLMLVERPQSPNSVEVMDIWSRSARVRWLIPNSGNSPILSYTVEYWATPGGHFNISVSSSSISCILRGLKPFTQYTFHVLASNSVGDSEPSQWSQFTTAKEEPSSPPSDLKIEDTGSTFVRLSWKPPPSSDWNGELSGYYVGYKQGSSSLPFTYNTVDAEDSIPYTYVLRGLRRGTRYSLTVRAFNDVGNGPPSEEITFATRNQDSLPQPILLIQDIGSTFLQLNWMTQDLLHSPITAYKIHYRKSGAKWKDVTIPDAFQSTYTLTDLDAGALYQVYVTAHGSGATSEPSEIASVRTSHEAIFHDPPPTPSSAQAPNVDDVTQVLYIVVPVAIATVIIVIVIVSACLYVYSKRPLSIPDHYGDYSATKSFNYMPTIARDRDIPITICGGQHIKYGTPYSTVPLTRPDMEEEPIYESVVGDTLRKIKQRNFDDDFSVGGATVV